MPVEPIDCESLHSGLSGHDAAEPLPAPLAAHLENCPRCRRSLASDPSRLFVLLRGHSPEPPPSWESLRGPLARQSAAAGRPRFAAWAWAAGSVAALALGLGLWLGRPGGEAFRTPLPERVAASGRGSPEEPGGDAMPAGAPPTLESIASPAARVVEFKLFGRQDQVTDVILIFDEGIDL